MYLIEEHKNLLNELIKKYTLEKYNEYFLKNSENYIGIKLKEVKDENEIKLGMSKFRGLPHLPSTFKLKLSSDFKFVAQYNLKELKKFDTENLLPEKGIFYVFYNPNNECYEEGGFTKEFIKLIYLNCNESELQVSKLNELNTKSKIFVMNFRHCIKLAEFMKEKKITTQELISYSNFYSELEKNKLILNYSFLGNKKYIDEMYRTKLVSKKEIILLKIPQDNKIGIEWGSHGESLLFLINRENLISGKFNNIKFELIID